MVNLNLFTKPYFDYQYNTGDHVDECFVYIDNQEDLTRCLYPQSGKNVKGNFLIPFGKHRIKLNIEIDDGKSYTYPIELCNALVTLKNGEASTVLYDRIILKRADSSFTNSAFTVEFDVDFPYTENNDYTLDITLGFYDETYDDGSSGPYVTEMLVLILIINGDPFLNQLGQLILTLFLELYIILLKKNIVIKGIVNKTFL